MRDNRGGRSVPVSAAIALAIATSCVPDPIQGFLPPSDLSPPIVYDAGARDARHFALRFSEPVLPIDGSFAVDPGDGAPIASADGSELVLTLSDDQRPGKEYVITGEVEDRVGNGTRFVFRWCGWNDRPPRLRITEVQTAKNGSKTRPHRDFIELEASSPGNLGGVELSWASSTKLFSYRFPGAEVAAGDLVVLHIVSERASEERDETDSDLGLAVGVDASEAGRDFWSLAGALPDASGAVVLRERPDGSVLDGLFYAEEAKTGAFDDEKLAVLVDEIEEAGLWPGSSEAPSWDDAFHWRPSAARSICRIDDGGRGPEAWLLSASSGQSPGAPNP